MLKCPWASSHMLVVCVCESGWMDGNFTAIWYFYDYRVLITLNNAFIDTM